MKYGLLVMGALFMVTALALRVPGGLSTADAATFNIGVSGFNFDPADRTISAGDTVEWSWSTGPDEHNVIFVGESETSGAPATSDTYSRTFNTAGTFDYYCEIHGTQQGGGMAGTITVQAASTNTPTNTAVPGTATRTATRTVTRTPTVVVTGTVTPVPTITPVTPPPPTTNTPAPIVSAPPTTPGGGSGGAVTAPSTGTGGADAFNGAPWWVSIALVVGGAAMIGGAIVTRRRAS